MKPDRTIRIPDIAAIVGIRSSSDFDETGRKRSVFFMPDFIDFSVLGKRSGATGVIRRRCRRLFVSMPAIDSRELLSLSNAESDKNIHRVQDKAHPNRTRCPGQTADADIDVVSR